MSKRFTDSRKWYDPWFRKLPEQYKLFWYYLTDTCDHAGFWKVDIEMASFLIGKEIEVNDVIGVFNQNKERIIVIRKDLWHLPSFIAFQYGDLKPTNNTHIAIINKLIKAGVRQGLPSPFVGVKDKEEDKVKEKVKEKNIYGKYKHVLLDKKQIADLDAKFGVVVTEKLIKELDEGIELKGYKYKNHYLAILKWAKNSTDQQPKRKKL